MPVSDDYLVDTISNMGLVDPTQLDSARSQAEAAGAGVVDTLLLQKVIRPDDVTQARALQCGMEMMDLSELRPNDELVKALPRHIARRYQVVPVDYDGTMLVVALHDPNDLDTRDALERLVEHPIEYRVASETQIKTAIDQFYGSTGEAVERIVQELSQTQVDVDAAGVMQADDPALDDDDAPLVQLVNKLIATGFRQRCSDVHLEPMETHFRVRYRVDGVLIEGDSPPASLTGPIISRIKIISGMSISEKRVPQDGRLKQVIDNRQIDFRVSCLPTQYGESIVMRILDKGGLNLGLSQLGFLTEDQQKFERCAQMPDGIMLVTGPTGSGKTTTLYSCLNLLNNPDKKIITVEDPVEYQLSGINQVQVNNAAGMSFSAALRAMLRQAPNIIMVGEIRDEETGVIAVNASLTGHFVFSTLHTNDAPGAITRMIDIGIKPFLVSASTRAILAQRLVRKICPKCIEDYEPEKAEFDALDVDPDELMDGNFRKGAGCKKCNGKGYSGRFGIFEMFMLDDDVRRKIVDGANTNEIREHAIKHGMHTLRMDGTRKWIRGMTSADEVIRVTAADIAE